MEDKIKVQELDRAAEIQLQGVFKGKKFARYGEVGSIMSVDYENIADKYKNMTVRSDDVFVATFPRSGTTRAQELVWLLMNDLDYDRALKFTFKDRYHFIAPSTLGVVDIIEQVPAVLYYEQIAKAPGPRFFNTHLPFSLLPTNLLDTAKVVYMARDPRDVVVSWYHLNRLLFNYVGDFKTFWNLFINDLVLYTPYFPHLKEAWALRHHPNLLFVFYEDMNEDLPSSINRIGNFLGKKVTNEEICKLCEHLNIDAFRNNKSVNPPWRKELGNPNAEGFVRKGKVGGWREHFDAEMTAQAQTWLRENLAGTDLRFPEAR